MQISSALLSAFVVAATGAGILWANPRRTINLCAALASLQTTAWLALWHIATTVPPENGLYWVRWTCAVGALASVVFYAMKETIIGRPAPSWVGWLRRHAFWIIVPGFLFFLPFTDFFIPYTSTWQNRQRGPGYGLYTAMQIALTVGVVVSAIWESRKLDRERKLELNLFIFGSCAMFLGVVALGITSDITGNRVFRSLEPLVVLILYFCIVYALMTHRLVDARQLFLILLQKSLLVAVSALCAFAAFFLFSTVVMPSAAFGLTVIVTWPIAALVDGELNRRFSFYPQSSEARDAAIRVGREVHLPKLHDAFVEVVKGWGRSNHAVVLSGAGGALRGSGINVPVDGSIIEVMRQIRWATPGRLARERSSPEREVVSQFLMQHNLGVLVIVEGPSITGLIGAGLPASRLPYTYPQVSQLIELAEVMQSSLERAHFFLRTQRAELLTAVGMLGAGLAHEIRNPLATIRSFFSMLPANYRDPVFCDRFLGPISAEAKRIEELTEQLHQMRSTRRYNLAMASLHQTLKSTVDLLPTRAGLENTRIILDASASPHQVYTDVDALSQVMLNLCLNAVQAVQSTGRAGWVRIATRNLPGGVEISVADSGEGIPEERRANLFQPFNSTKSTGFGLGLTMCSEIATHIHAILTVDPYKPGEGAVFRLLLPAVPPPPEEVRKEAFISKQNQLQTTSLLS